MRHIWLFALTVCLGCGGPPVKKRTVKKKMATLAANQSPHKITRASKTFIIVGNKALPNEDIIETAFAKLSLVAEVGPSPDGTQMGLPGVVCTAKKTNRPSDVPSHVLPSSYEPHALGANEARALTESTVYLQLSCVPDESIGLRDLLPKSEQAATAVARLMDGWISDRDTTRYWPRAAWKASRKKTPRYSAQRAYRIITTPAGNGSTLVYTRGLVAFGRPELGLFPIGKGDVKRVVQLMTNLADLLLEDKVTGAGYTLSYGSIDSLLIDAAVLLETYPTSARPNLPEGVPLLLLAQGSLDIGDQGAFQQYLNRLLAN